MGSRRSAALVAERGAVGSDTTMAVVGVAVLIEEGEMKRRKMEAALIKT